MRGVVATSSRVSSRSTTTAGRGCGSRTARTLAEHDADREKDQQLAFTRAPTRGHQDGHAEREKTTHEKLACSDRARATVVGEPFADAIASARSGPAAGRPWPASPSRLVACLARARWLVGSASTPARVERGARDGRDRPRRRAAHTPASRSSRRPRSRTDERRRLGRARRVTRDAHGESPALDTTLQLSRRPCGRPRRGRARRRLPTAGVTSGTHGFAHVP